MKDMQFRLLEEMLPWPKVSYRDSLLDLARRKKVKSLVANRVFGRHPSFLESSFSSSLLLFPDLERKKKLSSEVNFPFIFFPQNPEMVAGEKKKFVMRPPQVMRVGTKKTAFVNFNEMAKM